MVAPHQPTQIGDSWEGGLENENPINEP
ncbi:MAG: hypothetical protein DVB23_003332, partial [Verrucomicrobia bacterium]